MMGYALISVAELPLEEDVNMYIFVLADGSWYGDLSEIVNKNFDEMARSIGSKAIIVKGLVANYFPEEVRRRYFGDAQKFFWSGGVPALLITDAHPDTLRPESLRLFVPLVKVKDLFGSFDAFFDSLAAFARRENDEFLEKFEDANSFLDESLKVLHLKPNVFGFGLNISAFVELIRRRRRRLKGTK